MLCSLTVVEFLELFAKQFTKKGGDEAEFVNQFLLILDKETLVFEEGIDAQVKGEEKKMEPGYAREQKLLKEAEEKAKKEALEKEE
jgi:hypothetical protein